MISDLRYAIRQLTKSPGFTTVALITLALGIGLNTSMFAVMNVLLFRAMPYPQSARLVRIHRTSPQSRTWPHSVANFLDHQAQNQIFERMAAVTWATFNLAEPGAPAERLRGMAVTADFFPALGVQPESGRWFTAADDQPGHEKVMVITHELWAGRFAADPRIIGRNLRINGESLAVVGVMPAGFVYPFLFGPVDAWRPIAFTAEQRQNRGSNWLQVFARLKRGVSVAQADTEMRGLAARLDREYPWDNNQDSIRVVDLQQSCMDDLGHHIAWFTMGLGIVVLLIASANLANLQLARAATRGREYAVRGALGASSWQLMRPLLMESVCLALCGGLLGLLVAVWGNDFIGSRMQINEQTGTELPLDLRVLGFAFAVSLLAGVICATAPAWAAARLNINETLKQGGRSATGGRVHHRFKHALAAGQIAMALTLLAGAGFFIRGYRDYYRRDPGWNPDGVWSGSIALPERQYGTPEQLRAFQRRLLDRLGLIPGVEHAALSSAMPVYGFFNSLNTVSEGGPDAPRGQEPLIEQDRVSPDFFAVLRIPVREGRAFSDHLRETDPPVAVINETAAHCLWPGGSAIGKRFKGLGDESWIEVIGVVGDVNFPGQPGEPDTRLQNVPAAGPGAGHIPPRFTSLVHRPGRPHRRGAPRHLGDRSRSARPTAEVGPRRDLPGRRQFRSRRPDACLLRSFRAPAFGPRRLRRGCRPRGSANPGDWNPPRAGGHPRRCALACAPMGRPAVPAWNGARPRRRHRAAPALPRLHADSRRQRNMDDRPRHAHHRRHRPPCLLAAGAPGHAR